MTTRTRTGAELYQSAKRRIPGGTQLLSKRPEMFLPDRWPSYYSRAKGVEVWDIEGRRFIDMTIAGVGACPLGYADPEVDDAARDAIARGNMCTLNAPEEVELADVLCDLHPWAEMVRYARSGGEAMAIAIRLARAASGRDVVAFCGYHGWHDWYLAANLADDRTLDGHLLPGLEPAGVPRALQGTALPFRYDQPEELDRLVAEHGDRIGVIVMEPVRSAPPAPGFLRHVREVADRLGAVLIFDEITAGFRVNTGGIHLTLDTTPDVAVFAKAMSNGYPMAAVIGRRAVLDQAQRTFVSSTYWTDRIGPSTALATIRKYRRDDVPAHLIRVGERVRNGWLAAGRETGLRVSVDGIAPLSHFAFDHANDAITMQTIFTQELLDRGFLASRSFYATFAHGDEHIDTYLEATRETFGLIAAALRDGTLQRRLTGPVAHTTFARLV